MAKLSSYINYFFNDIRCRRCLFCITQQHWTEIPNGFQESRLATIWQDLLTNCLTFTPSKCNVVCEVFDMNWGNLGSNFHSVIIWFWILLLICCKARGFSSLNGGIHVQITTTTKLTGENSTTTTINTLPGRRTGYKCDRQIDLEGLGRPIILKCSRSVGQDKRALCRQDQMKQHSWPYIRCRPRVKAQSWQKVTDCVRLMDAWMNPSAKSNDPQLLLQVVCTHVLSHSS